MSSKPPIKVSGLIAAQKVTPISGATPSTKFDITPLEGGHQPSPGQEFMVRIDQLDDSPYQALIRRVLDPIRVDERGQSLRASGQATPVTVRRKPDGRFELIKGHYRKHGAKSIGWTELRALLVEADDREAKRLLMLDNESVTPSEYSYAHMFNEVRRDGEATTQGAIANWFGCSQAKVSNCLAMLQLPPELLARLDAKPALFGAAAAKVLVTLWEDLPADHDLILQAVDSLVGDEDEKGIKQSELRKTIEKLAAERRARAAKEQSAAQKPPKPQPRRAVIPNPTGAECYVTILKENSMVVEFKDKSIDHTVVQETINQALRDLISKSSGDDDGK